MTDLTPIPGQAYVHRYGGLYRVVDVGLSTVDKSEHVAYRHVYPFEQQLWIRPRAEWTAERFTPITEAELSNIIYTVPAETLQELIKQNKSSNT